MTEEIFVLCGGYGSRMGEYTKHKPKPLVEVNGRPLIYYPLKVLSEELTPRRFILLTGYRGEQIKDYLGNGGKFDINIDYFKGETGEVGDDRSLIRNIIDATRAIDGPWFHVFSGDYIFSRDFVRFVSKQPSPALEESGHLYFKEKKDGKHNVRLRGDKVVEMGKNIRGDIEGSRTFYSFSKEAVESVEPEVVSNMNEFINVLANLGKVRLITHNHWLMDIDRPGDIERGGNWLKHNPNF